MPSSPYTPELTIAILIAIMAHGIVLLNFQDTGTQSTENIQARIETTSFTLSIHKPSPSPSKPETTTTEKEPPEPVSKSPAQKRVKQPDPATAPEKKTPAQAEPAETEDTQQAAESEAQPEAPTTKELPAEEYPPGLAPWIEDIENDYLAGLRKAILGQRRYPARARRLRQEGSVQIEFTLMRDGTITGIHLAGSSGYRSLDNSAINALERLKKFRPIPEELQRESWGMSIGLEYQLR